MLKIWLELCRQFGIEHVLINLHSHADQVREFLNREHYGPAIEVFEEPTLLGSAGTLLANRGWIGSDDSFWVFYADVLTTANLSDMFAFHAQRRPCATLGTYTVPDPSRCGVITADENHVIREFTEKPEHPTGNVVFSGILIGTPAMLDAIPAVPQADVARHLFPNLLGRMLAYPIREFLVDIGTMNNYRFAQESWPGLAQLSGHDQCTAC